MPAKRGRGRPPKADKFLEHPLTLRLSAKLLERVDTLVAVYGTRATVLRAAIVEGVRVLERKRERDD